MGTWVDLSKELPGGSTSPARTTPVPFGGESDYMRMLREAQVVYHPLHKYKDKDKHKDKIQIQIQRKIQMLKEAQVCTKTFVFYLSIFHAFSSGDFIQ